MLADKPKNSTEKPDRPDDAVIGTAFRRSIVVFAAFLALGLVIWWFQRKPAERATRTTDLAPPTSPAKLAEEIPTVQFTDITAESGLRFSHYNGAYGEKLLPETMGGGVAFLDYDGDGRPDLLFVNGTYWPGHQPGDKRGTRGPLYEKEGGGWLADVTAGSGLDVSLYGMGVAVGDYD